MLLVRGWSEVWRLPGQAKSATARGEPPVKATPDVEGELGRPEQQLNRALLAFVGVVQIAGIPDFGEQA